MKKLTRFMVCVWILTACFGMTAFGASTDTEQPVCPGFENVSNDMWYKGKTTRAEFLKMLVTLLCGDNLFTSDETLFHDVDPKEWYQPYIATSLVYGFIDANDYGDTFKPNGSIPRREAANILMNTLCFLAESDMTEPFRAYESPYADTKDPCFTALYGLCILQGTADSATGNRYFDPDAAIPRMEAAVIFDRIVKLIEDIDAFISAFGQTSDSPKLHISPCPFPDGTTKIDDNFFYGLDGTFCYCDALTEFVIPDSVTAIGDFAFAYCSMLKSITIPESVTTIGADAFLGCPSLTIYGYADSFAQEYASQKGIPFSVLWDTDILASGSCGEHVTWTLDSDGFLTIYGTGRMEDFASAGVVPWQTYQNDILNVVVENGVTSVGDHAFFALTQLNSVELPDSISSIGKMAFAHCLSLPGIALPENVTTLGDSAFLHCPSLETITLPQRIPLLQNTFNSCSKLTSIRLPEQLTAVGNGTFTNCTSLEALLIPDSVTSIGSAFLGCESLQSITIPPNVTSIVSNTFGDCKRLKHITLSSNVSAVGDSAFYGCSGLSDIYFYGTTEEWDSLQIGADNECFQLATTHFLSERYTYSISSITIKDLSGNILSQIPTNTFLATVSVTNIGADHGAMIVLASYTASGAFRGLSFVTVEDVARGSAMRLSIPVNNSSGDVTCIKAFSLAGFGNVRPLGNTVSFPAA